MYAVKIESDFRLVFKRDRTDSSIRIEERRTDMLEAQSSGLSFFGRLFYASMMHMGIALAAPIVVFPAPTEVTTAIIEVAKKNIPAVVHIEVTERKEVANPFLPLQNDPRFRHFFGDRKMPKKFRQETIGLGSGMVIDAQGHILTNSHVAEGATKIEVQLSNGSRYTAELVGADPKTDIAVIRIPAKERLPIVKFGDSDKLEIGEWVVAIGHPRGLDQTVTQGIISAKHRRGILDPSSYQDFLQTDAPINPGNSGGPLLNLRGEVIGVNTAIASESGGSEGIGFAVPSNIALHIGKTIISHGRVERGWLGVSAQNISPEEAKALGLQNTKGAFIMETAMGGPAEKAGIRKGDVIIAYQGKEVDDAVALQNMATLTPAGTEARVSVLRAGQKHDVLVTIANMAEAGKALHASAVERLGAQFRNLTLQEREKYGLEPGQGVVVTAVEQKGPLGRVGFEAGDLILQVNDQATAGAENLAQLIAMLPRHKQVTLIVADPKREVVGSIKVTLR
jgi:serine protease Do